MCPGKARQGSLTLLACLLVYGAFALIGWRQTPSLSTADSHGYETTAWLMFGGQRLYTQLIHSQGPFYLWWGEVWWWLTGGWYYAFRLSAWLSYAGCLLVAAAWLGARGVAPRWRGWALMALFLNPITLWGGWQFLGLNETLLGALLALYGLERRGREQTWLVAFGLALALANRLMAAPMAAGLLLALFLQNRRRGVAAAAAAAALTVLFHLPVWAQGGFAAWLDQAIFFHGKKNVGMVGLAWLRVRKISWLLAAVVPLCLWRPAVKTPLATGLWAVVMLGLAGVFTQPVIGVYYLLPAFFGLWGLMVLGLPGAGATTGGEATTAASKSGWLPPWLAALPAVGVAAWMVMGGGLRPAPVGNLPGFRAACNTLHRTLPPKAPVLLEASISWPLVHCAGVLPWGGMTDTNLMLFDTVIPYGQFLGLLEQSPPLALQLYTDNGLGIVPNFMKEIKKRYIEIPQPGGSRFRVFIHREMMEAAGEVE